MSKQTNGAGVGVDFNESKKSLGSTGLFHDSVLVEKVEDGSNGVVCYVARNALSSSNNSPSISCVAPQPVIIPPSAQPATIDTSKISGKAVSAGAQKKATP